MIRRGDSEPPGGPTPSTPSGVKLKAVDAEGLAILSALVQDAILCIHDIAWLQDQRRFVMLINRFRWEAQPCERVLAGVVVETVRKVRHRHLAQLPRDHMLDLLTIRTQENMGQETCLSIAFAGGSEIEIITDGITVLLEDRGLAWPASNRPLHDLVGQDMPDLADPENRDML